MPPGSVAEAHVCVSYIFVVESEISYKNVVFAKDDQRGDLFSVSGTKNSRYATPNTPMPPVAKEAALIASNSEIYPIAAGPMNLPTSETRNQMPRNSPACSLGERSEPMVMTMPLPRPLPNPWRRPTTSITANVSANGSRKKLTDMISNAGTADHFLPFLSIKIPAGKKRVISIADMRLKIRPI